DHDGHLAGVLDAMPRAPGNAYRFSGAETAHLPTDDDPRRAGGDDPALRPEAMALQAESLPCGHDQPLALVARPFLQRPEPAPRAALEATRARRRIGGAARVARPAHAPRRTP